MEDKLFSYYEKNFGKETAEKIITALSSPPRKAIRVNTTRISVEELKKRMEKKGFEFEPALCKYGLFVKKEPYSIGASAEYLLGYYYIQDAVSMIPPLELEPKESDIILDMCAAPGGKTTFICQLMNNKGCVVALDIDRDKIKALRANFERMGLNNILIFKQESKKADKLGIQFDKILLDPSCSGDGMIGKIPEQKERFSENMFKCTIEQRLLLKSAHSCLKSGGTLVYSTCSLSTEENEEMLEYAKELGFELLPTITNLGTESKIGFGRRIFPFEYKTQGFFYAKMVKKNVS